MTDHSNFPYQEPVTITFADIQQQVKKLKNWTSSLDIIHTFSLNNWLKAEQTTDKAVILQDDKDINAKLNDILITA